MRFIQGIIRRKDLIFPALNLFCTHQRRRAGTISGTVPIPAERKKRSKEMNLLAKREHEVPAALERVFPGVDELVRTMFGRMIEPGSGLLRGSVFDSRWETEVREKEVVVKISCPGCRNSDFNLEIVGDFLNFKVRHCEESESTGKNKHYVFRERSCAEYEDSIKLPVAVTGAEAKAKYSDGVICVTIPRDMQKPVPAKTIKVHCDK